MVRVQFHIIYQILDTVKTSTKTKILKDQEECTNP